MSALPLSQPVTLDEFERMPEEPGIQELLDGEVVSVPPPTRRHKDICEAIFVALLRHFPTRRARIEDGFVIGGNVLAPDLAITHPDQGTERAWSSGAPLVAIEVASRGNTGDELEWKKETYLASGAQEVWIVYDMTRKVVVYRSDGRTSHESRMFSPALGLEFDVTEWFK